MGFGVWGNSPRLPAEKRLEQADPDRASFPLTQPSPHAKFSDATPPPPPMLWDPPQSLGGAANRCRGGSRLSVAPTGGVPQKPPPPTPPRSPPPPTRSALPPFFCEFLLFSCPGAGPAAEAARASVYNYVLFGSSLVRYVLCDMHFPRHLALTPT